MIVAGGAVRRVIAMQRGLTKEGMAGVDRGIVYLHGGGPNEGEVERGGCALGVDGGDGDVGGRGGAVAEGERDDLGGKEAGAERKGEKEDEEEAGHWGEGGKKDRCGWLWGWLGCTWAHVGLGVALCGGHVMLVTRVTGRQYHTRSSLMCFR